MSNLMTVLPWFVLILGALSMRAVPNKWVGGYSIAITLLSALIAWQVWGPDVSTVVPIMDYELTPIEMSPMRQWMVGLFYIAALVGALFMAGIHDRLQHATLLLYFAGGTGATLAGDWVSFFISFELIALAGTGLVLAHRTPSSTAAAIRYLVFQVLAGVSLLVGILLHGQATGHWSIGPISLESSYGPWVLFALGIKVGFPLLHTWLVDAYPKASLAGLAVLVAVATKVGLIGLMQAFAGEGILIPIGVLMAVWPVVFVLSEDDLRRVLAYSMMIQLGLMVVAVGVGTPLALDGVTLHIIMDVSFKMVLFMAVALLWVHHGTAQASQLAGAGRGWLWVGVCVAIAALANSALPGTGAFISKKLMLTAIEEGVSAHWIYWFLVSLSAISLLYAWVRVAWRIFWQPHDPSTSSHATAVIPLHQRLALLIPTVAVLVFGLWPQSFDGFRPWGSTEVVLTAKTLWSQTLLLGGAGIAYALMARWGFGLPTSSAGQLRDVDGLYRILFNDCPRAIAQWMDSLGQSVQKTVERGVRLTRHPNWPLQHLGRSWPIGAMALWVALLFAMLLMVGVLNH